MDSPDTPRRRTKPIIPARTSSIRKATATRDPAQGPSIRQLESDRRELNDAIKTVRQELKPRASLDSDYWDQNSKLCELERDAKNKTAEISYRNYIDGGGDLSRDEWLQEDDNAQKLSQEASSFEKLRSISLKHSIRLDANLDSKRRTHFTQVSRRMREAFVKAFNTSRSGFGLTQLGQGSRDKRAQSRMRAAMIKAYGVGTNSPWEPVLGRVVDPAAVVAAHLYPYKSMGFMDAIFGEGSTKEIFSPLNGLLLHKAIEDALDKGLIAIIPDVDIKDGKIGTHPVIDNDKLAAWQAQKIKNYKVWVLDQKSTKVKTKIWGPELGYAVEAMIDLHNRPLRFNNDFRPRSRYVWWTFLNSIQQCSQRQSADDYGVRREVLNSTRFWGTQGRYVHENYLLGFVEELGQSLDPETAKTIIDNGKEDAGAGIREADPTAVAVMSSAALLKSKEQEYDSDDDSSSESDQDDADEGEDENGAED